MPALNLIEETISHFQEGARSVRAHTSEVTYVITKEKGSDGFWITTEEPGFTKTKITSLDQYYQDVFGIEARY